MTAPQRPEWRTPGMTDAETRIWEAAERSAADAPELTPADDVYLALRPILGGCLAPHTREERGAA
jgi:hypothetical protein